MTAVSYQSIDTAISLIKQVGKGALLAKTDLENAYKQIPIYPNDFELLGFQIAGLFYYDKTKGPASLWALVSLCILSNKTLSFPLREGKFSDKRNLRSPK